MEIFNKIKLRFYGESCLRERSKPVRTVTEKEKAILSGMEEIMRVSGGIGLAAPQVGINKQIVIVDVGQGLMVLFNPRIVKKSGHESLEEGCLSLPGIYVKVRRAKNITARAVNEKNESIELSASGLLARALQHEIDHLRGRMIIDYAGFFQKLKLKKKLKELKTCARRADRKQ